MTDTHHFKLRAGCFFYSMLPGFGSVCAPDFMTQNDVLSHVSAVAPPAPGFAWEVFDRGTGRANPNPCNQQPNGRLHYLLALREVANPAAHARSA